MRASEVEAVDRKRVLLIGHGSSTESRTSRSVEEHAETIRDSAVFDEVQTAFIRGSPSVANEMEAIVDGTLIVVPVFMSAGYYTRVVTPRQLELHREEGVTVHYTPPIGTHSLMTEIVLERVTSVVNGQTSGTGVALVAHGNGRRSNAASVVRYHAARLRRVARFDEVRGVYLEQSPRVERLDKEFSGQELVVVPLFMAEGRHVREDIPERLREAGRGSPLNDGNLQLTEPAGTHPIAGAIALERATAALAGDGSATWAQRQSAHRITNAQPSLKSQHHC